MRPFRYIHLAAPRQIFRKKILAFCLKNNKLDKNIPVKAAEYFYDKTRLWRLWGEKVRCYPPANGVDN
jgi:hypothetical protein